MNGLWINFRYAIIHTEFNLTLVKHAKRRTNNSSLEIIYSVFCTNYVGTLNPCSSKCLYNFIDVSLEQLWLNSGSDNK
jgi:hypothetical protein